MLLRFTIHTTENNTNKEHFYPVRNEEDADKFIRFLMDHSTDKKKMEAFAIVSDDKTQVLKTYDMELLRAEKKVRSQKQRKLGNINAKKNGLK